MLKCAHCNSADTVAMADKVACLACQGVSGYDGTAYTGRGASGALGGGED